MENKVNGKFIIIIMVLCLVFIGLVIAGIVLFNNREPKVINKNEHGAKILLNYTNDVSGLTLTKLNPTIDNVGMQDLTDGNYLDFSVEVKLDNATSVKYEIAAVKDSTNSTVKDEDIRIYLEKENSGTYTKVFIPSKFEPLTKKSDLGSPKGSMVLVTTKKTNSKPDNYRLRMWVSDKATIQDGTYSIMLKVNGKAY